MPLLLLNKPHLVLSQFTARDGRPTLADWVAEAGVYPAGRLDYDSEGLILLTDDGDLQNAIANPKRRLDKAYWVQVEGSPTPADLAELRAGITSRGERLVAAGAQQIEPLDLWPRHPPVRTRQTVADAWLEIVLTEGRNRQVRRMTAAVGLPTLRLVRHRVGPFRLRSLQPGEHHRLETEFAWRTLKRYRRR
ncbi:MAG: pseudouridine synthase [Pseudomonadota bacterium]